MMEKFARGLFTLVAVVLLGGCSTTQPLPLTASGALPKMQEGAEIPAGFISFCIRFFDQCRKQQGLTGTVALDANRWRLLGSVNQSVNQAIWPQSDKAHYGRAEYWTIPTDGFGDCEDYALTKRKDLLASGIGSSALRLAVVDTPRNGRHAVLTVATDKGDFVLDNLTDDILPWSRTGFAWIEVQDQINPMQWDAMRPSFTSAQDSGGPTAIAARVAASH